MLQAIQLCRENDTKFMVSKILEYMKEPCPECEKYKRAMNRLMYSIWAQGCEACAVIKGCAATDHTECKARLGKWAYEASDDSAK